MSRLAVTIVCTMLMFNNGQSSPQSGVPTKEEISKVMEAVNNVFEGLKEMFISELDATDEAVSIEVEKLADRAKETLDLIEEMSLLKLTCLVSENTLCTRNSKTKIQKIVTEGDRLLDRCISQAGSEIRNCSSQFVAETNRAVSKGHAILDSLDDCMQKTGFQQFSCYRKVMNNDVEPLTETLLDTIRKHRDNHMSSLKVRSTAFNCFENVLSTYKKKVAEALTEALKC